MPARSLQAVTRGADSVGLFRTEVPFMNRDAPPDEDQQYRRLPRRRRSAAGRMLIIRTLDAGADKPIPYLDQALEANPFLGQPWHSAESGSTPTSSPCNFAQCCVAAADHDNIAMMFPMVATLAELRRPR